LVALEVICRNCAWRTVCGRDDAIARLRLIGLLRRDPDPVDELVATLLLESAPRMTCPICKEKQLHARSADAEEGDDGDWQAAVLCEICRQPIPPERLEALSDTKRCVGCQGKVEANPVNHTSPMSSFHSSGRAAMNSRMS
jgi:hypothetical protein